MINQQKNTSFTSIDMGHSHFAVLGYGVIVSTEEFLTVFPGSLRTPDDAVENEFYYCVSDSGYEIEEQWHINLHVDSQYATHEVFVSAHSYLVVDSHYGVN